jgi:hypothetical protein
MKKHRLLLILVAADVLLAFASVGAEAFFGWTLPPSLAEYTQLRFSRLPGAGDVIPLLLLIITVSTALLGWIGLVNYWRVARRLYLISLASWILETLISGPSVKTSVGAMFAEMNGLVAGAIIGLVYFSDLARRFEKTPIENTARSGAELGAGRI